MRIPLEFGIFLFLIFSILLMQILTKKLRLLLWIMVLFTACKETVSPTPFLEPDISEEKMIALLLDVHLAEAATQTEKSNKKDSLLHLYYQDVFRIHNISKEDFERNLEAWFDNPELADKLYEKVVESLNKIEAETYKKPLKTEIPEDLGKVRDLKRLGN